MQWTWEGAVKLEHPGPASYPGIHAYTIVTDLEDVYVVTSATGLFYTKILL
jgi:hypothetical protein